jgi:hypothetical protein
MDRFRIVVGRWDFCVPLHVQKFPSVTQPSLWGTSGTLSGTEVGQNFKLDTIVLRLKICESYILCPSYVFKGWYLTGFASMMPQWRKRRFEPNRKLPKDLGTSLHSRKQTFWYDTEKQKFTSTMFRDGNWINPRCSALLESWQSQWKDSLIMRKLNIH